MSRLLDLINAYGRAKFGDEWWPANPSAYLPEDQANELVDLLEQEDIQDAANARWEREAREQEEAMAPLNELDAALRDSKHRLEGSPKLFPRSPYVQYAQLADTPDYYCYGCDRHEQDIFSFLDTSCLHHASALRELAARHEDGEHNYLFSAIIGDPKNPTRVIPPTNPFERLCPLCIEETHLARISKEQS